ncbi:MAG TPA: peptidoglycan recognition family protein [Baekduia sp.]|nr:peptidoglycan recognition family protein [Baekduia sp.]
MANPIRQGDAGDAVRRFQHHLNDRLRARGDAPVPVNGRAGPKLMERAAFAAWFLGALTTTVRTVQRGTIPVGVQQLVAHPERRDPAQRRRARMRRGKVFPGSAPALRIITTAEWGARPPAGSIQRVGRPDKIIFHHTAGHVPPGGDPREQAKAYARLLQLDHLRRGFIDSGHNFLVTRSGHVLEGRHGSLAAIRAGAMVNSAHCVGQNHQPGIEHEHRGGERLTDAQRHATVELHAFICRHTVIEPSAMHPHSHFNQTECPSVLRGDLPAVRADVAARLRD